MTSRLDLSQTREWLEIVYGDTPGYMHISSTGGWQGQPFSDIVKALAYVKALDEAGKEGIYLRACTLRELPEEGGRGGDALSSHLPGLWADIDIAGPGHKTQAILPPDVDAAMSIVSASGLPEPTHWIHSGGGLYPWWLLREPALIDDLESFRQLSAMWQKILEASAKKLGYHYGSGVGDLSRVLRLPGTVNRKAGLERPCTFLEGHAWSGPTFTIEELFEAAAANTPEPPTPTRVEMKLQAGKGDRPGDDFNARTQWMDLIGSLGWQWVYKRGDKWHLRRPGKDFGEASATLSMTTDRLFVFSEEAHPFEAWKHYSKFEAYAALYHGGRFADAAKDLASQGYGKPLDRTDYGKVLLDSIPDRPQAVAASTTVDTVESKTPVHTKEKDVVDYGVDWQVPHIHPQAFSRSDCTFMDSGDIYADTFHEVLKYCNKEKQWYFWTGRVWRQDEEDRFEEAGKILAKACMQEAKRALANEEPFAKILHRHALKLANTGAPTLPRWAQSNPKIATSPKAFDSKRHFITVDNGTIDLSTVSFIDQHDPSLLLTKSLPARFDKDAHAPMWEAFLEQVLPDPEMRDYIQRAMGHTLLGEVKERVLFLLHGKSGTGKSQFIKVMELLFGDYAQTADPKTFNAAGRNSNITNDLNDLKGSRLVPVSELEKGERLNEALIKRLTGGDTAVSRALYQGNTKWRVEFCMWMATNHLPTMNSDDDAIWRRVKPIFFPTVVRTQGKEIGNYGELMFEQESSGILNWLLAGVRKYQEHGLEDLDQITEAVASYRQEVDTVAQFVDEATSVDDERLIKNPQGYIPIRTLYNIYVEWCRENNIRWLGSKSFGARMESLGFERSRNKSARMWMGLSPGQHGILGTMHPMLT